ncbi:MAG TPA: hypothetical protein VMC61_05640 [Methanocella sp.]|nr:hypothetical protein [Methanocella sp.]
MAGGEPGGAFTVGEDVEKDGDRLINNLVDAEGAGQGEVIAADHDKLPGADLPGDFRTIQPQEADLTITSVDVIYF